MKNLLLGRSIVGVLKPFIVGIAVLYNRLVLNYSLNFNLKKNSSKTRRVFYVRRENYEIYAISRIGVSKFCESNIVSNERGTTFNTSNNSNDTNPKSAFITYKKPKCENWTLLRERKKLYTIVFELYSNRKMLSKKLTFREISINNYISSA